MLLGSIIRVYLIAWLDATPGFQMPLKHTCTLCCTPLNTAGGRGQKTTTSKT